MDGFGVNTFRLVTSEGHQTLVKFHWRSLTEGPRYMSDEDAIYNGGKNAGRLFCSIVAWSTLETSILGG
jgi:catalase